MSIAKPTSNILLPLSEITVQVINELFKNINLFKIYNAIKIGSSLKIDANEKIYYYSKSCNQYY